MKGSLFKVPEDKGVAGIIFKVPKDKGVAGIILGTLQFETGF